MISFYEKQFITSTLSDFFVEEVNKCTFTNDNQKKIITYSTLVNYEFIGVIIYTSFGKGFEQLLIGVEAKENCIAKRLILV